MRGPWQLAFLACTSALAVRSVPGCHAPTLRATAVRARFNFDAPLKIKLGKDLSPPGIGRRRHMGWLPQRWQSGDGQLGWIPRGDSRDQRIAGVLFPSVANLVVVPLTGAVDTFWVGRMGDALALAGQGAANQLFGAVFFLMSFVSLVTVPLVAKAWASGDVEGARDRTCDSLFLSGAIGLLGTALLVGAPRFCLQLVLQPDALAMPFAARYLRLRSLSLIPALVSAVAFAAFRGTLDVVTPLRVSTASNLLNLILDPILIFGGGFGAGLGVAGAALATAASELFAGGIYVACLLRRKLATWRRLIRLPDASALGPLLRVSSALLFRTGLWNTIMLLRARAAQAMDPSGVTAAAYAITLQIYYLGLVFATAMQGTATALVASAATHSKEEARQEAGRVLGWSALLGTSVMLLQLGALPILIPLFTTVPAVRQALVAPAVVCALLQMVNCVSYTAEGLCMALGKWGLLVRTLASCFVAFLGAVRLSSACGLGLVGIWASLGVLNLGTAGGLLYMLFRRDGALCDAAREAEAAQAATAVEAANVHDAAVVQEVHAAAVREEVGALPASIGGGVTKSSAVADFLEANFFTDGDSPHGLATALGGGGASSSADSLDNCELVDALLDCDGDRLKEIVGAPGYADGLAEGLPMGHRSGAEVLPEPPTPAAAAEQEHEPAHDAPQQQQATAPEPPPPPQ